nr:MAG TPA: hypothetical protein [Caudoviricetes sp.]
MGGHRMTITIADGRGALWQWDTGRRAKIADGGGVKQIHYQNKCFGRSVDVDVGTDGTAIIPDELLQDCHTLTAYAYVTDDTGAYTMVQQDFIVHRRAKPAGYVYTPTDQMTLQTIQRQIGDLSDLTTEAQENLVAAINEAAASGGSTDAVLYTPQTLTEAQKQQARENVDAAGVFVINATPTSDWTSAVLDKTFAQIQEAINSGKTPIVLFNNSVYLALNQQSTDYVIFTSASADDRAAVIINLYVYPDQEPEYFTAVMPVVNSDGALPQQTMASDPTEDMQIATKKYVDDALGAIVDGTEVKY